MKRILLIIFLFASYMSFGQTTQTSYIVPSVAQMKVYFGAANRIYVAATDGTNADYVLCTTCTANETNVYAGAGGRKWLRLTGGNVYTSGYGLTLLANKFALDKNLRDSILNLIPRNSVPITRTITLNGVTKDLTNNISFTVVGGSGSSTWGGITGAIGNQTDLSSVLGLKVDKVSGKLLSSNDYTNAEKAKVALLSGTNTGDETASGIVTKLTTLSGASRLDASAIKNLPTSAGIYSIVASSDGHSIESHDASGTLVNSVALSLFIGNKQMHTSGTTVTASSGVTWMIVNPASTLASLAVTLPASPTDGQEFVLSFGGTITSGVVVTTLTLVGPTIGTTTFNNVSVEDGIKLKHNIANNSWYRIKQ